MRSCEQNFNNQGFTLIEILVASAIFVTATVLVSDLFVRVNNVQRKTQGIQTTATDARYAFETIVRETRLDEIDYNYYGGTVDLNGETVLALRNVTKDPVRFGLQTGITCPTGSTSCLAVCLTENCAAGDWEPMTPKGVDVTNLKFLIYPNQDPFVASGSGFNNNSQPIVSVTMTTTNTTSNEASLSTFTIQTAVSTRTYRR